MTIGILLGTILLFVTYHEFCLERLVWYESLIVLLFIFSHLSLLDTPSWETKLCYDLLELLSMLHLNLFELWNCSSASLKSFWARCALVFLKKCSLASLRFVWELVNFLRTLASLKLIWEKEILCSWSSLIFVWAYQKQHMKISPKVIDIQEGYNKNFHEDHWTK